MFAYCENTPISRSDPSGKFFFTIIGAVVGAAVGAIDAAIKHEDILAGALGGAVSGAISGAAADVIAVTGGTALAVVGVMAVAGAAGSLAENATKAAVTGEKIDWGETAEDMAWSAAFGGLFGYMGGGQASKLGDVAKRGLASVLAKPLKSGLKKWAASAAEETLSSITAGVGRFTAKCIRKLVTSIK